MKIKRNLLMILIIVSVSVCNVALPEQAFAAGAGVFDIYDNGMPLRGFSKTEVKLYNFMKKKFSAVADGTATIKTMKTSRGTKKYIPTYFRISNSQVPYVTDLYSDSFQKVLLRLTYDCPYSTYWLNVTSSYGLEGNSKYVQISLPCGDDFAIKAKGRVYVYRLDYSSVTRAKKALKNARAIVKKNAGKSDYGKLRAYFNAVKKLNTYNNSSYLDSTSDVDPWQFTCVFDKDPDTNGVCEAYAKAFNLLCDLTEFNSSKVKCYIVTGFLEPDDIGHMWNVVTLDGKKYYLVDVTNCDTNGVGEPDLLFPGQDAYPIFGDISHGYVIMDWDVDLGYIYDEDTIEIYGRGKKSILNIKTEGS